MSTSTTASESPIADLQAKLSEAREAVFRHLHSSEAEEIDPKLDQLKTECMKLLYQHQILEKVVNKEHEAASGHSVNVATALTCLFRSAAEKSFPPEVVASLTVQPATQAAYGDYQYNGAMAINKVLSSRGQGQKPQDIARTIMLGLAENVLIEKTEIAGPGFINIWLRPSFVSSTIRSIVQHGLHPPRAEKRRIIVDFSSPNIAKEMHVGHLRSTIIGDSLCRLLEFYGHDVLRINHVGDWGTQFGMLIAHLQDRFPNYLEVSPPVGDLQAFYKESKKRFDEEEDFKKRAYSNVVKLQGGDPDIRVAWNLICEESRKEFQKIYDLLDIKLKEVGESFYQPLMMPLVSHLESIGTCIEDSGCKVVFAPDMKVPLMLVKSDGGLTYDTTDLAALKYRLDVEKAQMILYVVDAGQGDHFKTLFGVGRRAGWIDPCTHRVEHIGFGVVLGEDKKKFKTRSGETIRLLDLLNEGLRRAKEKLLEKERDKALSPEEMEQAAVAIAYGCIKYSDLSHHRVMDYVFSFDKMLDDRGNTAVYLLYAYTRIRSIQRTANLTGQQLAEYCQEHPLSLLHPRELHLAKALLRFAEVLDRVHADLLMHFLCEYLYDLSCRLSEFYDECICIEKDRESGQVLNVDMNRMVLLEATASVFLTGFSILGIKPVTKM